MKKQRKIKTFKSGLGMASLFGLCGVSIPIAINDLLQGDAILIPGMTTLASLGLAFVIGASVNAERREQFKITNTPTS